MSTSNGSSSTNGSFDSSRPYLIHLTPKFVLATINGLVKMLFYSDATITMPYLLEQLFPNPSDHELALRFLESVRDGLTQAASENWNLEQIVKHFQTGGLTEEQSQAVAAVWKKEEKKIHERLVADSTFSTPHFTQLNWRLDVQNHSRYQNEMHQPTAIVQINTKTTLPIPTPTSTTTVRDSQLQFELDRSSVANVLLELEKIEAIMAGAQ